MIDIGLLLVRVIIGALLAGHGMQKLLGWFGGSGRDDHAAFLESLGYRRPRATSWAHGVVETAAGVLLAVGLLTPLAAAGVLAVMLNEAVVVHRPNGLWAQDGGYEYPLVLGAVVTGITLTGPGRWAIDTVLGWAWTPTWALIGILGGLVIGLVVLAARHREVAPASSEHRRGSGVPGAA